MAGSDSDRFGFLSLQMGFQILEVELQLFRADFPDLMLALGNIATKMDHNPLEL